MSKNSRKMEIQNPEDTSIQELEKQLIIANQKVMDTISKEIEAIEVKFNVSIGVQLDVQKLNDIIAYMIRSNKTLISLKFEIWKNP